MMAFGRLEPLTGPRHFEKGPTVAERRDRSPVPCVDPRASRRKASMTSAVATNSSCLACLACLACDDGGQPDGIGRPPIGIVPAFPREQHCAAASMTQLRIGPAMMPFEHDLNELRALLQNETDFAKTATAFHDGLGNDSAFHAHCHWADDPMCDRVRHLVEAGISHLTKRPISLRPFMLLQCPRTDFFHGGTPLDLGIVVYFYFHELGQGMAIVSPETLGCQHCVRAAVFVRPARRGARRARPRFEGVKSFAALTRAGRQLTAARGASRGTRTRCAPRKSRIRSDARSRMTTYVGSSSNHRAAKFGLIGYSW
jgi:hypothetical protein